MKRKDQFFNDGDRYILDFGECSSKKGFAQIDTDQDASYFGMWCNPVKLRLVSFCEGDFTILDFDDAAEFVDYIAGIAASDYFKGIDAMCSESLIESFRSVDLGDLLH